MAIDSSQDIKEIARKIAAHGGGAASLDLAFDLVLHGIVEQARAVSGATGAAIALVRDNQMVCRATSGENAPDLGVSVDAASGLTAICIRTGTVQRSLDTETDPGVDPETCQRLGARSMLVIPLTDSNGTFGVLQLFSSSSYAFGEQEMGTLLRLADQVAENRRALLQGAEAGVKPESVQVSRPNEMKPKRRVEIESSSEGLPSHIAFPKSNEPWTAVLFLLVIGAAISLGIVVGWSHGRKSASTVQVPRQSHVAVLEGSQQPAKLSAQQVASESTGSVSPSSSFHNDVKSAAVPAGGLVVTQNGKVIYRSPESTGRESPKQVLETLRSRELIHRVEPDYPPKARAQHIEGSVILDVEIAEDGSVTNTEVVSGNPLLVPAAVQAVRQWQYQADPGGTSRTRVTLLFGLPGN